MYYLTHQASTSKDKLFIFIKELFQIAIHFVWKSKMSFIKKGQQLVTHLVWKQSPYLYRLLCYFSTLCLDVEVQRRSDQSTACLSYLRGIWSSASCCRCSPSIALISSALGRPPESFDMNFTFSFSENVLVLLKHFFWPKTFWITDFKCLY